ncbi:hypothetical protein [Confluentibacter lentus]|uniref:hypothetical protein n=1 Tax=Confluentibacter lentus TaxID=1699412 RepID=UPI000C282953|nr:hypothetical protein [Confluentibacter lentus]
MKAKTLISIFFLLPFVATVFNLQGLSVLYISVSVSQAMAYGFLALLAVGIFLSLKNMGTLSKTAGGWIAFYIIYYGFAIVASIIYDFPINFLASLVPIIYFFGFYIYLSVPENRTLFKKVALVSFVSSSLLGIFLFKINWDLDQGGIYIYNVDRSGGVLGDANNAALVAVIAFILLYVIYQPQTKLFKLFKLLLLILLFYSLVITFSTTGFVVFIISIIMLNLKFFTPKRIVLFTILLPLFYIILINLDSLTSGLDLTVPQRLKIKNIVNVLTFNVTEVNSSGRDSLLTNLLNYVYANPIIGNGLNFANSLRGHNTIIGVWADAGIFALLAFIIMLGNYFKNAIKNPSNIRYFSLSILTVLCVFMLSLQTVINQQYLIALFVYIGYIVDINNKEGYDFI